MGSSGELNGEETFFLIDENSDPKEACKKLTEFVRCSKKFPVIGLDAEWTLSPLPPQVSEELQPHGHNLLGAAARVPKIRNPVSILQIANRDSFALLIRLRQINPLKEESNDWQIFFMKLKDLLNSTDILKVGVAIQTDTSHLFYDYGLYTVNCLDLQHIAASYNWPKSGLAYLAKRLCDYDLKKHYARANWDGENLSPRSLKYAADDAKLGVLIFEKLMQQRIQESKKEKDPVKNVQDFIKQWRYKVDVIYRHYQRPPPPTPNDLDPKKVADPADLVESQQSSPKLVQCSPQQGNEGLEYRTYKNTECKPYPKVPFCVLVLVFILILVLAVSLLFQLVQRADYSF